MMISWLLLRYVSLCEDIMADTLQHQGAQKAIEFALTGAFDSPLATSLAVCFDMSIYCDEVDWCFFQEEQIHPAVTRQEVDVLELVGRNVMTNAGSQGYHQYHYHHNYHSERITIKVISACWFFCAGQGLHASFSGKHRWCWDMHIPITSNTLKRAKADLHLRSYPLTTNHLWLSFFDDGKVTFMQTHFKSVQDYFRDAVKLLPTWPTSNSRIPRSKREPIGTIITTTSSSHYSIIINTHTYWEYTPPAAISSTTSPSSTATLLHLCHYLLVNDLLWFTEIASCFMQEFAKLIEIDVSLDDNTNTCCWPLLNGSIPFITHHHHQYYHHFCSLAWKAPPHVRPWLLQMLFLLLLMATPTGFSCTAAYICHPKPILLPSTNSTQGKRKWTNSRCWLWWYWWWNRLLEGVLLAPNTGLGFSYIADGAIVLHSAYSMTMQTLNSLVGILKLAMIYSTMKGKRCGWWYLMVMVDFPWWWLEITSSFSRIAAYLTLECDNATDQQKFSSLEVSLPITWWPLANPEALEMAKKNMDVFSKTVGVYCQFDANYNCVISILSSSISSWLVLDDVADMTGDNPLMITFNKHTGQLLLYSPVYSPMHCVGCLYGHVSFLF